MSIQAYNYTIDDSQWSTAQLSLSAGWNMLRTNGSNDFINQTQVDEMEPLLDNFWNSSVSWTTTKGASTTLFFVGTDIWAYGMAGPEQGAYAVSLNNGTATSYDAGQNEVDYHHLLFEAHGMEDGVLHYLTMTDMADTSLAFDVAYVTTGMSNPLPQNLDAPPQQIAQLPGIGAADPQNTPAGDSPLAGLPATVSKLAIAEQEYLEMYGFILPSGVSLADLAAYEAPYKFRWNAAAYFTICFAGFALFVGAVSGLLFGFRQLVNRRREQEGSTLAAEEGESYLIHAGGRWPRNRSNRKSWRTGGDREKGISSPIPEEDEDVKSATASGKSQDYLHAV